MGRDGSEVRARSFADRFWRDERGRVVVAQVPNFPLAAWLVLSLCAWPLGSGTWRNGFTFAGSGFLFVWAYLEMTRGVDYFRRLLGVVVLFVMIGTHVR